MPEPDSTAIPHFHGPILNKPSLLATALGLPLLRQSSRHVSSGKIPLDARMTIYDPATPGEPLVIPADFAAHQPRKRPQVHRPPHETGQGSLLPPSGEKARPGVI